jgi:hypothetical protein
MEVIGASPTVKFVQNPVQINNGSAKTTKTAACENLTRIAKDSLINYPQDEVIPNARVIAP